MLYYTHNTQILYRGGCSVQFLLMFTPCNFLDLCKLDLMIAVTTAQKKYSLQNRLFTFERLFILK